MILVAAGDWPLRISTEVVARVFWALWSYVGPSCEACSSIGPTLEGASNRPGA